MPALASSLWLCWVRAKIIRGTRSSCSDTEDEVVKVTLRPGCLSQRSTVWEQVKIPDCFLVCFYISDIVQFIPHYSSREADGVSDGGRANTVGWMTASLSEIPKPFCSSRPLLFRCCSFEPSSICRNPADARRHQRLKQLTLSHINYHWKTIFWGPNKMIERPKSSLHCCLGEDECDQRTGVPLISLITASIYNVLLRLYIHVCSSMFAFFQ